MSKKLNTSILLLLGLLMFTACQNKEKAIAKSFGQLVDIMNYNGLTYAMQYEPHAVKNLKAKQVKLSRESAEHQADRFQDHHYLTLRIDGANPGLARQHQDNYTILSEYLSDDYRNQFSLLVNGERKACVLHHAMFPPQNPSQIIVQLVFKDQGYSGQSNYFQDDITVVYFDKKNRENISWTFSASQLNQFPSLNNNYKNG